MEHLWIILACLSAIFVGVTSILIKIGVRNTNSHLATAIKTAVACLIAWVLLFAFDQDSSIATLTSKNWAFLILSGLSTGAAWLFQASALKYGDASKVEPILKLSTIFTMVMAFLILQEEFTEGKAVGMVGILMGTILMLGIPRVAMQVDVTKKPSLPQIPTEVPIVTNEIENFNIEKIDETISTQISDDPTATQQVVVKEGKRKRLKNQMRINTQIYRDATQKKLVQYGWIVFAALSSVSMGFTAIFGKLGVQDISSNVANSIITTIVLFMSVGIVLAKYKTIEYKIDRKSLLFLLLSGVTVGLSWVCYYTALKYGDTSIVVPIDSLSVVVTVVFAWLCLKEKITMSSAAGLILLISGTIMTTIL